MNPLILIVFPLFILCLLLLLISGLLAAVTFGIGVAISLVN
jgi:hypothetical protein